MDANKNGELNNGRRGWFGRGGSNRNNGRQSSQSGGGESGDLLGGDMIIIDLPRGRMVVAAVASSVARQLQRPSRLTETVALAAIVIIILPRLSLIIHLEMASKRLPTEKVDLQVTTKALWMI